MSLANLPLAAIPENQDFTNDYKIADIIVTDDGLGENLISLDGIDAAKFKVSGGSLYLKAGSRLDYETSHVLQVTVNVDDPSIGTGVDASAVVFIAVGDVNESPSLLLSNVVTTLEENADTTSPLKVADIAILDDALGNNVLTLGGSDAGLFRIMDAGLYIRQGVLLDYESFHALTVSVMLDDLTLGTSFEDLQTLSISLTDVNEAPAVMLQNITITSFHENTPFAAPFKVADIAILDDATGQNSLSLGDTDAGLFTIIDGGLYIKAGTSLDYETHPQLSVSVLASDPAAVGTGQVACATFSVTDVAVAALPDQLTIYNDNRGTGIDLDVLSNDFSDVGTLRIAQADSVAHGSLAIVSRNQGVENFLRYTPRPGFTGTESFNYVTTAGGVSSLTTVTLHVLASSDANRAPTVANLNVTALSGQAVSFQPFDRVQDLDGDVIHLIGTPSAAHGTVRVETTAANKTLFFYTPDNGFQGTDTFTYTVADPYGYESSANVTVNVSRPETQTVKDRYQVVSGTVLNANSTSPAAPARSVLTNDLVSGGAAVSAILVSDSAHGTLSFNPDGTFAYTPTTGYVGTDSFSYSLYDGIANTAPQTVDLVVNAEGTQVGPNGNIKLTDSGTANGAFNSNLGVTVQDGQFAIDPTSTYHPGNLVTSSNSLSTSDITTETSTDSGGVSTTTVTTVGLDKSHFAVVDENGYWSYLEFYTIPFDVTTTVTGVSSTHVFGSYSYTFHAWGDNTYSAFSFTTTNITNASGTYVNAPDGSQATSITYIWSDYVFATQTTTNITYFDTGVSLGSVNGFTHEDLSYTGLGPYSYAIDGGTVHGTFSNSGFETSHASTVSSYSRSENGWVGQGIGTAGSIIADFSSAKGSGGFHLSSVNANGVTSTTDGTLTESDDEVMISSAGAIYGLTSTGWALASGAGNSLGIGDYRESSIATGTYAYPVPGG